MQKLADTNLLQDPLFDDDLVDHDQLDIDECEVDDFVLGDGDAEDPTSDDPATLLERLEDRHHVICELEKAMEAEDFDNGTLSGVWAGLMGTCLIRFFDGV